MAHLIKIHYTYWCDDQGHRVPKDTPGARKVKEKSTKWYGCWKDGKKWVRVPLATDKEASQVMLARLIRTGDKVAAQIIDPHQPQLERPITEHLDDYLTSIRQNGRVSSNKYLTEKRRILTCIFAAAKIKKLADLTAEAIDKYMDALTCSVGTKRVHHTAINAFADWLMTKKRVAANPLLSVARPQGTKVVRRRRALSPEELQRLLNAARERPLAMAMINRGGRTKGEWQADLRPHVIEQLKRDGRERALLYKLAVYTGLRKGELASLHVAHFNFDRKPYPCLDLPGEFTKNGDDAKLLLVPALADELRQWATETGKQPADPILHVPDKMTPLMKKDLTRAKIAYKDDQNRYADFHALRKSAGTMLGVAGVPMRIRQLFLRHGDIRLTMGIYDDEAFSNLEEAVKALEKVNLQ